ncbi:CPBP family intramembrane glutamic endopeptidase [Neobacillus mesonae]|uniref:CPBP family intramembrane glutamic endopeptidase n=1 Tax=Neobacillus mesonae TaxID=1193713 RepID=UPI0025737342|nr:CPBP family intramembrane glutamic endopeptidase [Neobacillus mesonae]MED4206878.1 CPBP family intramembrane metalloprotease [Neobacillus mesonae]
MKNAWLVSFIRFPMLIMTLLIFFLLLKIAGIQFQFPYLPEFSTVYFTVVNVLCFFLLHHLLKKEGRSIQELIGFHRKRVIKDILLGILWLFVLYIPFVVTIMGTMLVMYGPDLFQHFQTVFIGNEEFYTFSRPDWLIWLTACISIIFPFLNAPIEELMYRGYAQPLLIKRYKKVWAGIIIPAVGFALQHMILAVSIHGAIVYAAAFFVWGVGSGVIYHKQKRLFPLIICHFIVNIAFGILPILFLIYL